MTAIVVIHIARSCPFDSSIPMTEPRLGYRCCRTISMTVAPARAIMNAMT